MSKHTPGPWAASHFADHHPRAGQPAHVYTEHDDYHDDDICKIVGDLLEPEELWANANLIAAAPELLAACKAARTLIQFGQIYELLTDAITKAEAPDA